MRVWIDQDLCIGDGLCEEACPDVFVVIKGIAYVRDAQGVRNTPGGAAQCVEVPTALEDHVIDAAEGCPTECVYIEI